MPRVLIAVVILGVTPLVACAQTGDPGTNWIEEQRLTPSDAAGVDWFGWSVALSGDVALVGAPLDDTAAGSFAGSATIFGFDGTSWIEEQRLTPSDAASGDQFGWSVALSGDAALVGADLDDTAAGFNAGSATIFRFDGTSWIEEQRLTPSDAASGDVFGVSVALSGDVALVGAHRDDTAAGFDAGSATIFRFDGTSWIEEQRLTPSDAAGTDQFGVSVALSGDVALVGALFDDTAAGFNAGSATIFRFDGTSWIEEQRLTPSDAAAFDNFGESVALSGDVALVGARGDSAAAGFDAGSATIFRFDGTSWIEEQRLTPSDAASGDQFGSSVALSGDVALVGARGDSAGSATIFRFDGTSWIEEQRLTPSEAAVGDNFGFSVALSGDIALVGANLDDTAAGGDAGSATIFRFGLSDPPLLTLLPSAYSLSEIFFDQVVPTDDLPEALGLTADGRSRILLTVPTSGPGHVEISVVDTSELGDVTNFPSPDPGLTVRSANQSTNVYDPVENQFSAEIQEFVDAGFLVQALVVAPEDFVRAGFPSDADEVSREIELEVRIHDDSGALLRTEEVTFTLRRPPVVMLHGLWSNGPDCWGPVFGDPAGDFMQEAANSKFGLISRPSYPNDESFAANLPRVRGFIQSELDRRRAAGYAADRVDLVGHSMGGVLGRLHISSPDYAAGYDDVHKLITVNSPHFGSPVANLLLGEDEVTQQIEITPIGLALEPFLPGSLLFGAVRDLQVGSPAITSMLASDSAGVPVHAIASEGGGPLITVLLDAPGALLDLIPEPLASTPWVVGISAVVDVIVGLLDIGQDFVYQGQPHDLVVTLPSQVSGLFGDTRTVFQPSVLPLELAIHTTIQKQAATRIVELLDAKIGQPLGGPFFFGFPEQLPLAPTPVPPAGPLEIQPDLVLTSAQVTAPVAPGAVVDVEIASPAGVTLVEARLLSAAGTVRVTEFSGPVSIQLPLRAIGSTVIGVLAVDSVGGVHSASAPLEFSIQMTAQPISLEVIPESWTLHSFSRTGRWQVLAEFDDGVRRDVTDLATFADLDPTATQTVDATTEGLAIGTHEVQVSFDSLTATLPVVVSSVWGDFDGDGVLGAEDLAALLEAYTGPNDGAQFETPELALRDTFDSDGDSDIDAEDVLAFVMRYPGELEDCTGSGVSDLQEIAMGLEADCNENWSPDGCDITTGVEADSNADGIPDTCQGILGPTFVRGDCDQSGAIAMGDPICLLMHLFGGQATTCVAAMDFDADGQLALTDPILLLYYMFANGDEPAAPFPSCAPSSPGLSLSCDTFSGCN